MQSIWVKVLIVDSKQPWVALISNRRLRTAEVVSQAEARGLSQALARGAPGGLGDAPACTPSMRRCSDCSEEDLEAAAGMCLACMECSKAAPQTCGTGPFQHATAREVIALARTVGGMRGGGNGATKPSGGAMASKGKRGGGNGATKLSDGAMGVGGMGGGGNGATKPSVGAMAVGGMEGGGNGVNLYNAAFGGDFHEVQRLLKLGASIMWVKEVRQ